MRRWREDEGEMETDGSEEEVGLGFRRGGWALEAGLGREGSGQRPGSRPGWALFSLSLIFPKQ